MRWVDWIRDYLQAASLAYRALGSRLDRPSVVRHLLADSRLECRRLYKRIEVRETELKRLKDELNEKEADLRVSRREIEGLVQAHQLLCAQMESKAAQFAVGSLKYEIMSGGAEDEPE